MIMKRNFNLIFLVLIGIFIYNNVMAQRGKITEYASPLDPSAKPTPIYVGPAAGVNIMGHNMTVKNLNLVDEPMCPDFTNAEGLGFYAGLTFEYLIGDVATSNSSIIVRALYNTYPGSVTKEGDTYPIATSTGEIVNSTVEHDLTIECAAVTLEVMYKFNPIPGFGFGLVAGPTFDYILSKDMEERFMLVAPNNAQFEPKEGYEYRDNNRTIIIPTHQIDNASAIRIGLKVGVQYEILLGSKFYIVPSAHYNLGITNFVSDFDWRINPLQVGLDARYAFAL
jgi:hypothetical protein